MFENYDFKPGRVVYNPYKLTPEDITDIQFINEDMFQVEYPNHYLMDVGWYGSFFALKGVFIICIIKNFEWENPVFREEYRSITELYEGMRLAIKNIKPLINPKGPKAYG